MKLDLDINNIKSQLSQLLAKKAPAADENASEKSAQRRATIEKIMKPINKILSRYSYEHEDLLGIDISAHYIRLCQMKNLYGQWTLNNLASTCMETQFRNSDIHSNPDLYIENLRDLIIKNGIKTKEASFTLPTSSSIIKIIRVPEMDENDFAQAAAIGAIWEGAIQLEGNISEYSVFYHILKHNPAETTPVITTPIAETPVIPVQDVISPVSIPVEITAQTSEIIPTENIVNNVGENIPAPVIENTIAPVEPIIAQPENNINMPAETVLPVIDGPTMDVLFVASKMSEISLYADIIRRVGLTPVIADVRCLTLKHLFETDYKNFENTGKPYAFMEFGPDENYVFIVDDNNTSIYNLYVSEEDKSIIAQSAEDKERLKTFVSNYAMQAQQLITGHEQSYNTGKIKHIFVFSSAPLHVNEASASPLIKTFVEEISLLLSGYTITECDICNHIIVPEQFAKKVNAEGNISPWASTVGIAARRVDPFEYELEIPYINKVNLLPGGESYKETQRFSMLSLVGVIALAAFLITQIVLSFSWMKGKNSHLETTIAELEHVKGEYDEKFSESQRLSVIMTQVKSLDSIKDALPSNQSSLITAYEHVSQVIPEGVWLNEINFSLPNKVQITGSSINDNNILDFTNKLNDGTTFQKMSLKNMNVLDQAKEKASSQNTASTTPQYNSPVKNFTLEGVIVDKGSTKNAMQIISSTVKEPKEQKEVKEVKEVKDGN